MRKLLVVVVIFVVASLVWWSGRDRASEEPTVWELRPALAAPEPTERAEPRRLEEPEAPASLVGDERAEAAPSPPSPQLPAKAEIVEEPAALVVDRIDVLGEFLFKSKLLSHNGQVSCATCHVPEQQFADGETQSKGVMKVAVGANTPSLVATGAVAFFPSARADGIIAAATLEERCVAPIANPLEMGSSVEGALVRLRNDPESQKLFTKHVPGAEDPFTEEVVGLALAAFVHELEPERTPYDRYLDGEWGALSPQQKDGLEVFRGRGRCANCHSGESFSDGMMHEVGPGRDRLRKRRLASRELSEALRKSSEELRKKLRQIELLIRGGAYHGGTRVQTLPLWDVARTGPYFRDGTIDDLAKAIDTHLEELRDRDSIRRTRRRGRRDPVPDLLDPNVSGRVADENFRPEKLSRRDRENLVAFLGALSPE